MPSLRSLSVDMLVLLAGLLAACGGSAPEAQQPTAVPAEQPRAAAPVAAEPTAAPAPATSGGSVSIGRSATPDSLNPGVAYLPQAFEIMQLVYDSLIGVDMRNQAQPQLAKQWSVGLDGKVWTFKLYEGAKWHDGQPLTAEDVAFTFNITDFP